MQSAANLTFLSSIAVLKDCGLPDLDPVEEAWEECRRHHVDVKNTVVRYCERSWKQIEPRSHAPHCDDNPVAAIAAAFDDFIARIAAARDAAETEDERERSRQPEYVNAYGWAAE